MLVAFHKPCGVLSQFTSDGSANRTLAEFGLPKGVYAIGRLDADSEGLLLLGDEDQGLLDPSHGHTREYWVQVERVPTPAALQQLREGVDIKTGRTKPCRVRRMPEPKLAPREPPIRFRKTVPTTWLAIELTEGKNRQVRRMTAKVGHPTVRLLRAKIGKFSLGDLPLGSYKVLDDDERKMLHQ